MRKKKIYLDTSVVSYLRQEDAPNEMRQTQELWGLLKTGKYDVYISEVVVNELSKCFEPRRSELLELLSDIEYTDTAVESNAEIIALAEEIKKLNIRYKTMTPEEITRNIHEGAKVGYEIIERIKREKATLRKNEFPFISINRSVSSTCEAR